MRILGIETSCDETSVAVVEVGVRVLSHVIATTKQDASALAGVIPEDAARKQLEAMLPVLHEAKISWDDIDAIAVTRGPGLLGSLLIGTTTARLLSSLWKKPLIGVHHTLGHLTSTWLEVNDEPEFPILTLSASGGHTDLWYRTGHTTGTLLGSTRDDAAGEAFDKGASMLGLSYPGGPSISKDAEKGDYSKFKFPHPLYKEDTLDFSFSGLKTSLKYTIAELTSPLEDVRSDLAASFQHAICEHLLMQVRSALKKHPEVKEVHIVGGVSANTYLRELLSALPNVTVRHPTTLRFCTDNAAMIAAAGYFLIQENADHAYETFDTQASIPLKTLFTSMQETAKAQQG